MKNNLKITYLNDCILIEDVLVIGDIHVGCNEYGERVVFPGIQLEGIINKLEEIFGYLKKQNKKIKKIIQLGDFKHDFGNITDVEWRETIKLIDYFIKKVGVKNLFIIKGNHDNVLEPNVRKKSIKLKEFYKLKRKNQDICFMHGNKLFEQCLNVQTNKQTLRKNTMGNKQTNRQTIFLVHLHPAITLSDKYKSEKYKCFLHGKWNGKEVYILPSFSSSSFGYDLRDLDGGKEKFFIIPSKGLKNFEVIIYNNNEKKEYNFGKLKDLI